MEPSAVTWRAAAAFSRLRARCCTRRIICSLDEATASLDEAAEAALYRLLQDSAQGNHGSFPLAIAQPWGAFHGRRVEHVPEASTYRVREVPRVSAAE